MKSRNFFKVAALAAMLCAGAAQAGTELINGDFEVPTQGSAMWGVYNNFDGWTGGVNGIELRNNVAGAAYSGLNFVELDVYANSSMSQTIDTTLGQAYTVSFAYAPREGVASSSNGIEVFWNGASQGVFTGDGTANSGNVWTLENLSVTGALTSSSLTFQAVGTSDGLGGSLDAVSVTAGPAVPVTPVPEPETYAMVLAGLGLFGFIRRRKSVKKAA